MQHVVKTSNGIPDSITKYRKEKGFYLELSLLDCDTKNVFLCARWYQTGTVNYCCVWISGDEYLRGGGEAGGYGYHKESASFESACDAAGIAFSVPIAGTGRLAIEDGASALADKYGITNKLLHWSHA